eukprot:475242_1
MDAETETPVVEMADKDEVNRTTTVDQVAAIHGDAENQFADNVASDEWPQTFTPIDFTASLSDLRKRVVENSEENLIHRVYRLVLIVVLFGIFLPVCYVETKARNISLIEMYGFALAFIMFGYAAHLLTILFRAYCEENSGLYRVYTLNNLPPKWAKMSISYRALLYQNQPIESISEFSAIQGGIASTMLFGTAVTTLTLIVCAYASEMAYHYWYLDTSDVFILMGALGLVVVGTFELDPNCKKLIIGHYCGVVMSLGNIIGFNHQQFKMVFNPKVNVDGDKYSAGRLWYPIFIDIVALVGLIAWQMSLRKGKIYSDAHVKDFDPKVITRFSLTNLLSEAVFFIASGTALCSWLIMYPLNCVSCDTHYHMGNDLPK